MRKAFVTGITGFAGSHLAENLIWNGSYSVSGTYLADESLRNVTGISDRLKLHKVNLQNYQDIARIMLSEKPDLIFHLAALTAPGESFENPSQFITNNIEAQVNLLESVRKAQIMPRILIVSSAEVYGNVVASDLPIDEKTQLAPVNPYAVSKVAQDFLGLQYYLSYKIPIIRVRPFNHIGARQSPSFVVASFAKKIAEIEKGKIPPVLKVGNLAAKRDFTDVRDTTRAYVEVLEKGKEGEAYNIGSGRSYKIEDILNKLLSFSNKEIKVERDQSLMRPIDVPDLVCDNKKIKTEIGWTPEIPIEKTLRDTLDYWRSII